jgi:hypothetical protein
VPIIDVLVDIVAILFLLSRLLSLKIGNPVQLCYESFVTGRGLREVLGKLLLLRLIRSRLLSCLLLSLPVHHLNLPILRLLKSHPLPRRRFIQSMTCPFEVSQWPRFLALFNFFEHDDLSPHLLLGVHS